jgi:TldD protein
MLEKLSEYLSQIDADYSDIRYEKMVTTKMGYNKDELALVNSSATDGYVIRVLIDGGFASIAVTSPDDITRAITKVCDNARILGKEMEKPIQLKFGPVVVENVPLELDGDPRTTPITEKLALTKQYNDLVLSQPNVQTTTTGYNEVFRNKYFVSSRGTRIHEPIITTSLGCRIVCKKGEIVQSTHARVGGSEGFNKLLNREDFFLERAKIANQLLDAPPVKGGTYNVVLDSSMAGVFTHEAFGHFSEADLIENSPSMLEKMQVGTQLGSEIVDIIDDATARQQVGYYKYDDEGVAVKPVTLMEKGVLKGRLHSMRTAHAFDDQLTGHTISEDSRYEPIIRMGCIYIKPKNDSVEDLIKKAKNGLYVLGAKGGQTSGENFTFGAQYAFYIEDGKIGPMVRDINIMGNLFDTLKNISAISDSVELSEAGGCGKGQLNIKSCHGGPHILINNILVGGVQ